jgi:hypothetical protein
MVVPPGTGLNALYHPVIEFYITYWAHGRLGSYLDKISPFI